MKKLIMVAAVVCTAVFAKAAAVDWKVTGAAAQKNYMVYVLTDISDTYDSVDALAAASIGSATIAQKGTGTRATYGTGDQKIMSEAVTKTATYYYAIVSGADAKEFTYIEATGMAGSVYDPQAQETSPGVFSSISAANILAGSSGTIGAVPEPTSGLLLLLGMAGLALRRKQK